MINNAGSSLVDPQAEERKRSRQGAGWGAQGATPACDSVDVLGNMRGRLYITADIQNPVRGAGASQRLTLPEFFSGLYLTVFKSRNPLHKGE